MLALAAARKTVNSVEKLPIIRQFEDFLKKTFGVFLQITFPKRYDLDRQSLLSTGQPLSADTEIATDRPAARPRRAGSRRPPIGALRGAA
jgi:hypothetical protein